MVCVYIYKNSPRFAGLLALSQTSCLALFCLIKTASVFDRRTHVWPIVLAMPSSTSLPSPQSVLPSLAIAGTCFIWAGSFIDGSLILLLKAVFSRKHILPGTQSLLKRSFTGIYWPLDFLLGILVVFFWEAVDGSHPTSSTLGLYFIAQYLPILTTVYTDSFRTGNAALKSGFVPSLHEPDPLNCTFR